MAGKEPSMELQPWQVRAAIYDSFLRTGAAPTIEQLAQTEQADERTVTAMLRNLHVQHHIVIDADGEVIAAHPFSNVPTTFDVTFGDVHTQGFCIWDALGIAAMSGKDTVIDTACGFCLHRIHLE